MYRHLLSYCALCAEDSCSLLSVYYFFNDISFQSINCRPYRLPYHRSFTLASFRVMLHGLAFITRSENKFPNLYVICPSTLQEDWK
jgi:hypothetical protein